MRTAGCEPLDPTGLLMMSEAELASLREGEGARIARRRDRCWEETFPGFYQPVSLLSPLEARQAGRPSPFCWGYRGSVSDAREGAVTASIPSHLLSIGDGFDENSIVRNRRSDLRKCREMVEFMRLGDSGPLLEQAYAVFESALRRVAYWRPLKHDEYLRRMKKSTADDRKFFIGGIVDGRLGGYMEAFAVDGTLYLKELIVAAEALGSGISTGLYVEAISMGVGSGKVDTVCSGLHAPENEGLCRFKSGLGFQVVQVPAVSVIPKPIGAYIRARRPGVYYRLTGKRVVTSS